MLSMIKPENFTPLQRSKLTWIDRNGQRCFANICFRRMHLEDKPNCCLAVVSERSDNPGMSVSSSLTRVFAAVRSMFPEQTEILLFERYDDRSSKNGSRRNQLVRVLEKDKGKPERVSLEDSEKWVLNYYFNDRR